MDKPTFDVSAAQRMKDEGRSMKTISAAMGVSYCTIRTHLDPTYRERLNANQRRTRAKQALEKGATVSHYASKMPVEDVMARLAEIPKDTRTRTQIICGDPIPSRSALAQWTARNQ